MLFALPLSVLWDTVGCPSTNVLQRNPIACAVGSETGHLIEEVFNVRVPLILLCAA